MSIYKTEKGLTQLASTCLIPQGLDFVRGIRIIITQSRCTQTFVNGPADGLQFVIEGIKGLVGGGKGFFPLLHVKVLITKMLSYVLISQPCIGPLYKCVLLFNTRLL